MIDARLNGACADTTTAANGLLYLSRADVELACQEVDPVACVAHALTCHAAGEAELPNEAVLRWQPSGGGMARTINMPGLIAGPVPILGTKIINASTENPSRGLPRAAGLTVLFHPVTARPEAIMQAANISALRTAAVSTLAALHLRTAGAQTLAVIGAGPIAHAHIALMTEHLDVERVVICDLVADRARALATAVASSGSAPAEVVVVDDAQTATRAATIVVTATTTTTPYVRYDWLRPGCVVVNVSLDDVEEAAYLRADRLYVDDWDLIVADSKRLMGKLARAGKLAGPGEAGRRPVDGTLGQLITGACPGRADEEEIVVVNPFGMAIADLAVASRVYEVALVRRYGLVLEA